MVVVDTRSAAQHRAARYIRNAAMFTIVVSMLGILYCVLTWGF